MKQSQKRSQKQPTVTACFPTFIYRAPLAKSASTGGLKLRRELRREADILREIDAEGLSWSEKNYPLGYTSYGSMDRLHKSSPTFSSLEKEIDRHVSSYARKQKWDLRQGRLEMSSCWINVMPAGAAHSLHLHPLSVVSGTFYVQVPKGSSPIKFEDPRLERFMAQPPRLASALATLQPFLEMSPKEGDVILFESWLRHEVPALRSGFKSERISVSFNYDWI